MKKVKNKESSNKFSKLYLLIIIFMFLCFSTYLFYKYEVLVDYNNKILEIQKELDSAKKKGEDLKKQEEYKNSKEYIEKLAREKLGMLKSNEIIFYDDNK